MGILDKIRGMLGFGDNDESDNLMNERFANMSNQRPPRGIRPPERGNGNVISFREAAASHGGDTASMLSKMRVVVIEPRSFDDSQQIANYLKDRKPVLINFENTDSDVAMKIVDFISGATYALNGEIKKVSHHVFLCAPNNVNVAYTQETSSINTDLPWNRNKE